MQEENTVVGRILRLEVSDQMLNFGFYRLKVLFDRFNGINFLGN